MTHPSRIHELTLEIAIVNAEIIEFHEQLDTVKKRKSLTSSDEFDRSELSLRRVIDRLETRREDLLVSLDEALASQAPEGCTCGGMGICTVCVLTTIETEGLQ